MNENFAKTIKSIKPDQQPLILAFIQGLEIQKEIDKTQRA